MIATVVEYLFRMGGLPAYAGLELTIGLLFDHYVQKGKPVFTLTYGLVKELQRKLKHLIDSLNHSIHSAQQFLNIKYTSIDEDEIMPTIQTPNNTNTISKDGTLKLLDLCLTTHFIFNSKIYGQINGTPMGSTISRLIAEAIMQRLERTALPTIRPKVWICNANDTCVITKHSKLEEQKQKLLEKLSRSGSICEE
eukprot:g39079.t1